MMDLYTLKMAIEELSPQELAEIEHFIHQRRLAMIPQTSSGDVNLWAAKLDEAIKHFWESFSAEDAAEMAELVNQGELDPDEMRLLNWMDDLED